MSFIPLTRPWIEEEDITAVTTALREGNLMGDGPQCRELEILLAERLGAARVLLTTSCTHALELAMMVAGLGPGDEVILPSFTFTSTATCVVQCGATPVFADIDERHFNLDPASVQRAITPRTRALLVMHYAGHACPMAELQALADQHGLMIIEDAAHGLDARYQGRELGTLGRLGTLSFHATKNLVCGEGGALICTDEADGRKAEIAREKGTNRAAYFRGEVDKYSWVAPGSSYVLSNLLGALALQQFRRLDAIGAGRRRLAQRYLAALADLPGLQLPTVEPYAETNWHIFATLVDPAWRPALLQALKERGVGAASHYVPLHSSPYGQSLGWRPEDLPVTERLAAGVLRLPIYPQLTDAEVDTVSAAVRESLVVVG
jgi:dTDP-4-amino-4,6-dideoxygalactose transaminase